MAATRIMIPRAALVVVALILALAPYPATGLDALEPTTIAGEVKAAEYDDEGNVVRVLIDDLEYGDVLVDDNDVGEELLDHVGAVVTASGDLREHDDDPYAYLIRLVEYTVDEPAEPETLDSTESRS